MQDNKLRIHLASSGGGSSTSSTSSSGGGAAPHPHQHQQRGGGGGAPARPSLASVAALACVLLLMGSFFYATGSQQTSTWAPSSWRAPTSSWRYVKGELTMPADADAAALSELEDTAAAAATAAAAVATAVTTQAVAEAEATAGNSETPRTAVEEAGDEEAGGDDSGAANDDAEADADANAAGLAAAAARPPLLRAPPAGTADAARAAKQPAPATPTTQAGKGAAVVYMHMGDVGEWMLVSVAHARLTLPRARIFVVSLDAGKWKQPLRGVPGVELWRPRNATRYERMRRRYLHASANRFEYERYCVARHFLLLQLVQEQRLASVLSLDLDIAMFGGDALLRALPPGTALSDVATFATHWTPQGLASFCAYLEHFYHRPRKVVARDVARIGTESKHLKDKGMPDWWPARAGVPIRHVSDMHLLSDWLLGNASRAGTHTRIACPRGSGEARCKVLELAGNMHRHPVIEAGGCTPAVADAAFPPRRQGEEQGRPLQPLYDGVAVPALHFQGHCKPLMPHMLCPDLMRAEWAAANTRIARACKRAAAAARRSLPLR